MTVLTALLCFLNIAKLETYQAIPWSNAFWPGLTPFGPPMCQAEAETEFTLSASSTTEVGQKE